MDFLTNFFNDNGYIDIIIENEDNINIFCDTIKNKKETFYDTDNVELMHYFGILNRINGNTLKTEKYYLLAIEGQYLQSIYNLADCYHDQKKYNKALKYYLMAIEKNPKPHYLNNYANCYYKQKKYNKALKYYLMAIEKNPNPIYLNNCSKCYNVQKKNITNY